MVTDAEFSGYILLHHIYAYFIIDSDDIELTLATTDNFIHYLRIWRQ